MKKKATKILALALAFILVAGIAVVGTIAYLTSKPDPVVNTFTIGNITITLDEDLTDAYGVTLTDDNDAGKTDAQHPGNTYKLIPGQTYDKNPTVHVAKDSEACYIFVKVENGIADLNLEAASTTGENAKLTIADQIAANEWTQLKNGEQNVAGVYYKVFDEAFTSAQDLVVFENFTLKTDADVTTVKPATETETNPTTITVTAYAIQYAGFGSNAYDAWTTVSTAANS